MTINVEKDGVKVRIIEGESVGVKSEWDNARTPIMFLDFTLTPGTQMHQPILESWNSFVCVLEGEGLVGSMDSSPISAHHVLLLSHGDGLSYKTQNYKMVHCACGLEAVIRTSWTNRNPSHRFYGCPTLSPTCVNFLWWFDPPMCQRSVQIILVLLRSRNELEEILAMVEEKRRKEVAFLLDVLSSLLLERLPGNLVDYKTREDLKLIQKAVLVKVIELKKELRLQVLP
ncbi:zinc finger, GRF-type containing protein [Tanacetum coccineum]